MEFLNKIDNQTLVICQCLLAAVFTVVLIGVRRLYPGLRGVGAMASGFFAAVLAILLDMMSKLIPPTAMLLTSAALGYLCYIFLYWGVLRFCQAEANKLPDDSAGERARRATRGQLDLLCGVAAVALALLAFSLHSRYEFLVRVTTSSLTLLLGRMLMAVLLLRRAAGRHSMVLFGLSLIGLSLLSFYNGTVLLLHGSSNGLERFHTLQTLTLLVSLLFLCIDGIFYLAMLAGTIAGDIARQTAQTAEFQSREQILKGEERLRFMAEAMPQKVFMTRHDGTPEYHNQEWEAYSGLTTERLAERSWAELIHPDDVEISLSRWNASIASATPFEVEQRFRSRDGSYRWHLSRAHPMRSPEGELVMWIGSSTDIQDQKLAEAALRKSEKLAVAGRLAASISHEINNPLEAVMNLLYLIKSEEKRETVRTYAQVAEEELARVAHIVTHTLQFHRQPTAATEELISKLLEATVGLYSGRLSGSSIELESRFSDLQPIVCFPAELRQVFANLLGNAFDASRKGGRIQLRTREAVEPRTGRAGVRVTIADTGCGMDANTLRHLFEPFFTTKGNNGTGLGLWISAEILERHQSIIRVRSSQSPGHSGTVFSLFFPHEGSVAPLAAETVSSEMLQIA